MSIKQYAQACAKDPRQRLLTAKHELAHAMAAYAMDSSDLDIRVYHKPKQHTTPYGKHYALGVCVYTHARLVSIKCFCAAAPYACPLYPPDPGDKDEFFYAADLFNEATGLHRRHFKSFVMEPLKEFMEAAPVYAIVNHLTGPLAQVGRLRVKTTAEFEKFFPKTISLPYLRALSRNLRSTLADYPFVRE
jgi:hypothetical protein